MVKLTRGTLWKEREIFYYCPLIYYPLGQVAGGECSKILTHFEELS